MRYSYPVYFCDDLFSADNPLFCDVLHAGSGSGHTDFLCVVDHAVALRHPFLLHSIEEYVNRNGSALRLVLPPLLVEGGERAKNDARNATSIHDAIRRGGICRHSYVVAIGGGAVIDMVGYAAATAHRGVRLIRVPTTVLAQADAAIGVKNGINAFGRKNFVGSFAPPAAVLNDFNFLTTLSERDWLSGVAEAVKVALLKDERFFDFIEAHASGLVARDMTTMREVIYRCAQLHLEHISSNGDPFEFGSSRPLDSGHWAAHKLEQLSHFRLRHGEAVAIGLSLDSTYAMLQGLLSPGAWQRILNVLSALSLPTYAEELGQSLCDHTDVRSVLSGLAEFREHLGGQLCIMLIQDIGRGIEVHDVDERTLVASISLLKAYQTDSARSPAARGWRRHR